MKGIPYAGELNRRIEFFENTTATNAAGESVETPVSLGKRFAKRVDATGGEEEDGRLIGLGVCRFQVRFDATLFAKGSQLFIKDFEDDQWEVAGPPRLMDGRRRFMEFKCRRRGED